MDGVDGLVLVLLRQGLRLLDRLLRFLSEFVESNHKLKGQVGACPTCPPQLLLSRGLVTPWLQSSPGAAWLLPSSATSLFFQDRTHHSVPLGCQRQKQVDGMD